MERPIKAHGHTTVVVSLLDGSFEASQQGQGTLTGQYVTHIVGQLNPETGQVIWGEGYLSAANRDRLFIEMTTTSGFFYITGGTGRFEGATGSGTDVASDTEIMVDPIAGTMTMTYTSIVEATVTY